MNIHTRQPSSPESAASDRFVDRMTAAVLTAGVALSLIQFLFNRSLWWDEAALALNIIHRSSAELLQPLDYAQVAPIMFLQIEKLFTTLLPNSEYGLRLFPLLCFWASLYFFRQITKKLLHPWAMLTALSLFVFSYPFLYYSSEAKQYMPDVLVTLCMFCLVLKDYRKERNRYLIFALAGTVAVFLSNVAPMILSTCGVYLLYDRFFVTRRKNIFPLMTVFAVWLGAFLLYYVFFIHEHPWKEFMVQYWKDAFLPVNPFRTDFYQFLFTRLSKMCAVLYNFGFANIIMQAIWDIFFTLVLIAGTVTLVRDRKINILIFTFTPLLLHLLLSALRLYPFTGHFILHALPGIILVFAYGFDGLIQIVSHQSVMNRIPALAALFCILIFNLFFMGFPFEQRETKNSIKYVLENSKGAEKLYVLPGHTTSFKYYTDTGVFPADMNILNDFSLELTKEHFTNWVVMDVQTRHHTILNRVKTLRGRNWVIFGEDSQTDFLTGQFRELGYKKLKEFKQKNACVCLYDFGE
jgi:hypothetical protein